MARQMKDSGIAWIGEMPEGWELQKGKYLYRQRSEKGNSIELQLLSPTQKYGVIPQSLYEKISGMKPVQLDAKADLEQFKSIYARDFCISLRSFQGGFEYSQYNGVVSPAYQVFYRQSDTTYDAFYRYIFKEMGFIGYMNSFTKSFRDGKSIAFDDFAGTLLPVPPIAEQHRIAAFLDRRCAEIDAVIERTKATIEEYKKLKQAVITEAVTKGVRGERKMKDSGIEWIGEIPEEWEVLPHKYVMHKEKSICEHYAGEDIISLTMNGVIVRDLTAGGKMPTTFDGYQYVEPDDMLLCLFDIDVTPRCVGIVRNHGVTSPAYSRFKVHVGYYNAYYDYLLRFIDDEKAFIHLSKNLRSSLTETDFGAIKTISPSYDEQVEIAAYLDEKCAALDTLIAKKTALLTELEAYKKSLIYEYVTGKREVQ